MINRSTEVFRFVEQNYWSYYRELEDGFFQIRKYVSFSKKNFSTFSIEILKLFQAVCSEIDVIGKALAKAVNPDFEPDDKRNSIYKWWYEIQDTVYFDERIINYISGCEVELNKYTCVLLDSIEFVPWAQFHVDRQRAQNGSYRYKLSDGCALPKWWKDYNSVKHNRTSFVEGSIEETNYSKANLGNLSEAFAALYVLEMALLSSVGTQNDLEAFAGYSVLFEKIREITSAEIGQIFATAQ